MSELELISGKMDVKCDGCMYVLRIRVCKRYLCNYLHLHPMGVLIGIIEFASEGGMTMRKIYQSHVMM